MNFLPFTSELIIMFKLVSLGWVLVGFSLHFGHNNTSHYCLPPVFNIMAQVKQIL